MTEDNGWRDKYFEALKRLNAEEVRWDKNQTVVRRLIGRLCLAAQGRDVKLDTALRHVSDAARRHADADELQALIEPLSQAVAALDEAGASGGTSVTNPALGATSTHMSLTTLSSGGTTSVATLAMPSPPAVAVVSMSSLTTALDRLEMVAELRPLVIELRERTDQLTVDQVITLLTRVARVASEQYAKVQRDKIELESLVQHTTERLEEITGHLTGELAERSASLSDTNELDLLVATEVERLRTTALHAANISELRDQVHQQLDAVTEHLHAHRVREEARVSTYRERVSRMRARINELERETRNLNESLQEGQRLAMIDALTAIPNRAAYDDRVDQEYVRWKRFGKPVSIVAWDIDHFKAINDVYGHKAGDKVLRILGQQLARHIRQSDFVARYGGEEFVMLLVGATTEMALALSEKIRIEISRLGFHFQEQPVTVTASCGISTFCEGDTIDAVFDRADRALYRAKEAGRNRCMTG